MKPVIQTAVYEKKKNNQIKTSTKLSKTTWVHKIVSHSYRSYIFHFLNYLMQKGEAHLLSSRDALSQSMECNATPGWSVLAL